MTATLPATRAEEEIEVLLEGRGLGQKAVAAVYFSFSEPESFIGARDAGGALTRLIEFMPLPVRGAALLDAIAAIDENAPRLIANYREAYPELLDRLGALVPEEPDLTQTGALAWLLGAASLALGLEEADLVKALLPGQSGVKVDTVVIEQDGRYFVDGRRMLRSLMSYRIAGVPRDVLARSIFESLADFAADAVRRLLQEWDAAAIVCAGDLFARNEILRLRMQGALLGLRLPRVLVPAGGQ